MIEGAKVDDLIESGSAKDRLNAVFLPPAPLEVIKFFRFMQSHITLQSNGMGVSLRESRDGLAKLMKRQGYDYEIYQPFIEEFEEKLMKQFHDSREEK